MIIDEILSRKNGEKYDAKDFYYYCNSDEIGWGIARAMDGGSNNDVIAEIDLYLIRNGYLPEDCEKWNEHALELVKWIESVDWLN